jgi:hypothetical protein
MNAEPFRGVQFDRAVRELHAIAECAAMLKAESLECVAGFLILVTTQPDQVRRALRQLLAGLDPPEGGT